MTYTIPQHISPNKIFIINRSELEGRIDPHPYHFERINAIERLSVKNELFRLNEVVKSKKVVTNTINETDKYIGLENIESNTGEYISSQEKQSISSAGVFKKGQILFPKLRPYLNKVHVAAFDGICSTEFHIFDSPVYRNEFVAIYLRSDLIVNQTKHLMTGNTLPRLQTEDIKRLPVPKISIEKQDAIIAFYQAAYTQKQQKEAEAQLLLASIDAYLLKELGITLPEKDNSLQSRIFTTAFSEVTGDRLDPNYNSKIEYLLAQKAHYKFIPLKSVLTKSPQYGANEEAIDITNDKDVRYIRITDITEIGTLKPNGLVTAANTEKRYLLSENDLLFARSGSVGRCYIHKEVLRPAIFAGYLIRFLIDPIKANPDFIFYYCHSSIYKFWVSAIERPAVQSNINSEEFKSLPIPLPSLQKQNEIAAYIADIRKQAKHLQTEADAILQAAKKEVEKQILG